MTKVIVERKVDVISTINISGHSLYANEGSDIVCASISTMTIMTINLIFKILSEKVIKVKKSDANINIEIIDFSSNNIKILINNLIESLKELEIQYPKNIKIKFQEV